MNRETFLEVVKYIKSIIKNTEYENHTYVVGGACRDYVLNANINDIDLVVDLPNGGIKFANWLCDNHYLMYEPVIYPTYGTAMFKLLEFPELELEIVETRKEQYKDKNSRNPDVVYGSLEEDCMRRDLTINALYYDITNEKIIDLVGGQEDIRKKIIKTPADPDIIFDDDPLRMLRCCRFSSRYGWRIDAFTILGIKHNAKRLKIITQERITDEITKSLMTALHPSIPFILWDYYGLMEFILPELCCKKGDFYGGIERHLNKIQRWFDKVIPELYFAAIFKSHLGVLKRMKLSNDFICLTEKIVRSLEWINCYTSHKNIRKFGVTFGEDTDLCIGFISTYIEAYNFGTEYQEWLKCFTDRVNELKAEGTMFDHTTVLPIDGNDIMKRFKLKPSKEVKKLLDEAWNIYYNNPKFSKDDLLNHIEGSNIICG